MSTDKTTEPHRRGIAGGSLADASCVRPNRRGSTAIEFTMLAVPFSMLVFAILESCISFAGQEVMANATDDVARQLRTGQLHAANVTETSLKKMICDRLEIMVAKGCPDLFVDLRDLSDFRCGRRRSRLSSCRLGHDKHDLDTTGFPWSPAGHHQEHAAGLLQMAGHHRFHGKSMSNLKGGKTLHFATVTWQNEPFDD